jgi:hypothetical protein
VHAVKSGRYLTRKLQFRFAAEVYRILTVLLCVVRCRFVLHFCCSKTGSAVLQQHDCGKCHFVSQMTRCHAVSFFCPRVQFSPAWSLMWQLIFRNLYNVKNSVAFAIPEYVSLNARETLSASRTP